MYQNFKVVAKRRKKVNLKMTTKWTAKPTEREQNKTAKKERKRKSRGFGFPPIKKRLKQFWFNLVVSKQHQQRQNQDSWT